MPDFKPAYLIHGDDHGRIAERRARLRAIAEPESGAAGLELFEGDSGTPEAVAAALGAMTFALGRRFVIVDGVERWKDAEVAPSRRRLKSTTADTLTVAFFAREDGRAQGAGGARKAVEAAGGEIAEERTVKPRELPRWSASGRAELGSSSTTGARGRWSPTSATASSGSCASSRSSRSSTAPASRSAPTRSTQSSARSAERKAWTLADALVAGDERTRDARAAGAPPAGRAAPGLLYQMARRVRQALEIARRWRRGSRRAGQAHAADALVRGGSLHRRRRRSATATPSVRRSSDGGRRGRDPRRRRRRAERAAARSGGLGAAR